MIAMTIFKISSANSYRLEPFDKVFERQKGLCGDRFRD